MNRTIAKQIFGELVARTGSLVTVSIRGRFPGGRNVGGKYSMNDHCITMYLDEIKKQCLNIFGSLERYEEVLGIVFAHELGHSADIHLAALSDRYDMCEDELERKKIALLIEENAWHYAEEILTEADQSVLQTMIYVSLQSYREAIAQDIA
ncbi:hypothetical protein EJP77_06920 [Paenibacillus zeisoli]|uniref:Peptidase M48 domain-containing protein n=1 Tax=Paenibacillus zeisoli TaxID=2496267 RepID=A0A433XH58_9BACL|nr:hypothetical protein [Paenibacillus zeisoli]RUT33374.1 hypothetical protein EJP77_06920 [Paenibacillus zeisoli]